MAATVILVEATPRRASDGAAQTVRLAGGGGTVPYRYGGVDWRAGIDALPRSVATLAFDGEQLGGGGTAQALEIGWGASTNAAMAAIAALYWADAPVTVRIGPEDPTLALPPVAAAGLVLDTAFEDGRLKIALADAAVDLKRPLLTDRFGGTGGVDGPAEWKDRIKTRAWGRCFNVPGDCIDKANNIWCFGDPARAWQAFDAVRDMGVPASGGALTLLAWQESVAATFAALQAAVAPAGGGVLCPSIACIKWWTQPAGDLHADIRGETAGGYVETAPEIAARIVAARSGLSFASGAVAAAASARSAPVGWRVESDAAQAADELSALLAGVSLSWVIVAGAIEFRAWDWGSSTRSAVSQDVTRRGLTKPVAGRKLGYRQNQAPMGRGELAGAVFSDDLYYADGTSIEALKPAELGATVTATHTAAAIAGQGALATRSDVTAPYVAFRVGGGNLLRNSSFEGPTWTSGSSTLGAGFGAYDNDSSPSTVWSIVAGRTGGSAQRVSWTTNASTKGIYFTTAAGVDNSGLFVPNATMVLSFWAKGSGSAVGVAMATAWNTAPGVTSIANPTIAAGWQFYAFRLAWGASVDPNGFLTIFPGLATGAGSLDFDDVQVEMGEVPTSYAPAFLPGEVRYDHLKPNAVRISYNIVRADGTTTATETMIVTASGTAAAIAGQGALATLSSLALGGSYLTGFGALAAKALALLGSDVADSFGSVLGNSQVITGQGTAAGIAGQGALATLSSLAFGTGYLTGFAALAARAKIALGDGFVFRADGTTSLTDLLAVTSIGTAAAIAGQGAGATANSLTDLDPTAAASLAAAYGAASGVQTVGSGDTITKVLASGASVAFAARFYVGGSAGGGNVQAQIIGGPKGGALTAFATGPSESLGPYDPGGSAISSAIFTNTTGADGVFAFQLVNAGSGGGFTDPSKTFLRG